jgi:hypothetical protein
MLRHHRHFPGILKMLCQQVMRFGQIRAFFG